MSVWLKNIRQGVQDFPRDNSGGVATIFALSFVPVAFLSLVMIDFSRASTARTNMQQTLDASTLLAARSTAITDPQLQTVGSNSFNAQLATNLGVTVVTDTYAGGPNNTVVADATGTVAPMVAGMFLGGPIKIGVHSEVVRSMNKLEIAMVLDTTGSMAGSKISNLQTAADDFIDTMASAAAKSSIVNPVKIAIVPFSSTVKVQAPVDLTSYSPSTFTATNLPTWLDGRARMTPWNLDIFTLANASTTRIDRFAVLQTMRQAWGGCVENRAAPFDVTDDPPLVTAGTSSPTATQAASMFAPYFWPDEPDTGYKNVNFGTPQNNYIADGFSLKSAASVLTSWLVPQGASAKYKSSTPAVGWGPNKNCTMQALQPLTTDFTSLKTTVSGLSASGETNIPIGLAWGWHALSPNLPLANGSSYTTPNLTKIIVLMTDGDNTMDPVSDDNNSLYHGYGYIWQNKLGITSGTSAQRTAALVGRMQQLCSNIKTKGIVVYTVGVGVSVASKALLQACATTPDQYYDVNATGSNMVAAFSAIAGSIQNLRISK
jgi:Flp pilus assembly protein TadG